MTKRVSALERWEVAHIKAMLLLKSYTDQDILAYFTRPTRSINHRAIAEIRTETKHKSVRACSVEQLDEFLASWPSIDPKTGLNLIGDELLIKAREAMIAAVHSFNSAGLQFRAELFIVTSIIAWTYLMHAWFKSEGISYHYKEKTAHGAEKYWDLGFCLRHNKCPLSNGTKKNLEFLIELRHEIEHRSTSRIDDEVGAKLQACCINFNDSLKNLFGNQYGLEKQLHIALQFVSFGPDQRNILKKQSSLPNHVATFISAFENKLTQEELSDSAYRMRVAFIPLTSNRAPGADWAVEVVKPDSDEALAVSAIFLKEVNKKRYTATQVVDTAKKNGYKKFAQHNHSSLWKRLDAKDPSKGYGCAGDYKNTWVWYESWIGRVLEHCKENAAAYS